MYSLFNYYFDFVLKVCADAIDALIVNNGHQEKKKWILYADDLVLFCKSIQHGQRIMEILSDTCKRFDLTISLKKQNLLYSVMRN